MKYIHPGQTGAKVSFKNVMATTLAVNLSIL
jgi:hypothetical protein